MTEHRNLAWVKAVAATHLSWILLEHLDEDDKQLVTGLALECFGQGYEAGYERAETESRPQRVDRQ